MSSFYHPDRSGVVIAKAALDLPASKRLVCEFLTRNKSLRLWTEM
jgi:hypothetical protein